MNQGKSFLLLIILFLFVILPGSILAADVVGTVTDTDTGLPISNVIVKIIETGDSSVTDVNGNYFIPNVADGLNTLLVGTLNYTPMILSRTIGTCCIGSVGDANLSRETIGEISVGDITTIVDFLFGSGAVLPCFQEADANQSGNATPNGTDITVGDISTIVDNLFGSGTPLPSCL